MKTSLLISFLLVLSSVAFSQNITENLKFNHLYVVVDSLTFNAILDQDELFNEFANIDAGLPGFRKADTDATILYFRGKNTYVEIMAPKNKFNTPFGSIGLGFSWDTALPFTTDISSRINTKDYPDLTFERHDVFRKFGDEEVFWLSSFYTKSQSQLGTWYALYNPSFLNHLFQKNYTTYQRSNFLENVYDETKILVDVSEIVLRCIRTDFIRIKNELEATKCKTHFKDKNQAVYKSDDVLITLLLDEDVENSKIEAIRFQTKGNIEKTIQLGSIEALYSKGETLWLWK